MKPKKAGTLFAVLMISMIAFGFASAANTLNIAGDFGVGLVPSNLNFNGEQKINEISDPSFSPNRLIKRVTVNVTNTTNTTNKSSTTNSSNQTKNSN